MKDLCRYCGFEIVMRVGDKTVRTSTGRYHYGCWTDHKKAVEAKKIADSQSSFGDYVPLD